LPTLNEHDPSVAESITTTAEAAIQRDLRGGSRKRALTAAFLAGLAAFAFVAAIVVSKTAYPLHSGDHDEPVYIFQAQMLLEGHATLSAAEQERFFKPWLSGRRGDRLVLAFTAGWPAALAVTELLFGNMRLALGLSAAAASVLCFLFARELLGEERRAVVAAALFTVSPFFLSLSGTYLNYVFTLALELGFGFCLLRGIRTGSRPSLVVAGLLVGLAFLSRPYDAVLFSIPLVTYLFATRRRKLAQLIRELGWAVLGAAPIAAITLAYNTIVTGAPLRFPTTLQSGGRSRFGFGSQLGRG
jgi:hypothetical protein